MAGGGGKGPPPTSDSQPCASPMAWLVRPPGDMLLTTVVIADQLKLSAIIACGQLLYCSAGNRVGRLPTAAGSTLVSVFKTLGALDVPRSVTQPFQVLWSAAIQYLPAPWQVLFIVYPLELPL